MAAQLKLAAQLQQSIQEKQTLGAQLAAQRRAQIQRQQAVGREKIEEQIRQAPFIAQQLIEGLPTFLKQVTDAGYGSAYVVHRLYCVPFEYYFPGYTEPPWNARFDESNLTVYAARRYLKGIIQHVALWGLKQDFRVGLVNFTDPRGHEVQRMVRFHGEVLPFYMPGMFTEYIPESSRKEFLHFAW